MSTLNINAIKYLLPVLDNSLISLEDLLDQFANSLDFESQVIRVFGDNIDLAKAKFLVSELAKSNSSVLPKIEVRDESEINGAKGAFAVATNTIYLSREFLGSNNASEITAVLIEELGSPVPVVISTAY